MKKLLATLTTVAMLATTTSAFAEVITNNDGYKKADGTYSIVSDLSTKKGQLTLLIIPEAAYLSTTGIEDEDILYIDQGEYTEGLFQNVGILGGKELADGTYYAKIGGKELGGIIVEKFTISSAPVYTLGDINSDGIINITDVVAALNHYLEVELLTGNALLAANVAPKGNIDDKVNITDVVAILNHYLEVETLN